MIHLHISILQTIEKLQSVFRVLIRIAYYINLQETMFKDGEKIYEKAFSFSGRNLNNDASLQ